jgi:hypothetical protein
VVWVDDRWRARLLPGDYPGPHQLIRKGSRFQALCELYHHSGVLHVKVGLFLYAGYVFLELFVLTYLLKGFHL